MSYTVDFNIQENDSDRKKYSPRDLENLHDSLLGVLDAQGQNYGVLVYAKNAPDADALVDVMVVFMEKDSKVSDDSLQINVPSSFELLANAEKIPTELAKGKIVAYDSYNHPVYVLLEENDLNYYSHTGVKIASQDNFLIPPAKEDLSIVQDDGDVVVRNLTPYREHLLQSLIAQYDIPDDTVAQMSENDKQEIVDMSIQPILDKINSGHLSHITVDGFGSVYRLYNNGDDCVEYYTRAGHKINCMSPQLLGIGRDESEYQLHEDGSLTRDGIVYNVPSIDLEVLRVANGIDNNDVTTDTDGNITSLPINIYHYIDADGEFSFYTHAGVKMTSFDISAEKTILNVYKDAFIVDVNGQLTIQDSTINKNPDIDLAKYENVDGVLDDKYRVYEGDGSTQYNTNDGEPLYAILDEYDQIKFVSKTGVSVAEVSAAIPTLTQSYLNRVTKSGEYYKLPSSTVEVFDNNIVVSAEPVKPMLPPAIEIMTREQQLTSEDLKLLFLNHNLTPEDADVLITEFTFADGDANSIDDEDGLDISFNSIVKKVVEKNNALNDKITEFQTLTETLDNTEQSLQVAEAEVVIKDQTINEQIQLLSDKDVSLTEKDQMLQAQATEFDNIKVIFEEINTGLLALKDDFDDVSWFAEPLQKVNTLLAKIPDLNELQAAATNSLEISEEVEEVSVELIAYLEESSVIDKTFINVNCLPIDPTAINIVDEKVYDSSDIYSMNSTELTKNIEYSQDGINNEYIWEVYDYDGHLVRRILKILDTYAERQYRFFDIGNTCVKSDGSEIELTCDNMYKSSGEYLFGQCNSYITELNGEMKTVQVNLDTGENIFIA